MRGASKQLIFTCICICEHKNIFKTDNCVKFLNDFSLKDILVFFAMKMMITKSPLNTKCTILRTSTFFKDCWIGRMNSNLANSISQARIWTFTYECPCVLSRKAEKYFPYSSNFESSYVTIIMFFL